MLAPATFLFLFTLSFSARALAQDPANSTSQTQAEKFLDLKSDDYKSLSTRVLVNDGSKIFYYQNPSENILDPNLGFRPPHSEKVRTIMRTEKEVIFDVAYSFDQYGRRTARLESPAKRKKFLLLTGCSFTFGYGVNDNQTLNYFLGKELPEYFPYNYGIGASGPHTALALTEERKFREQIPQPQGVMIYVSLGKDHIDRATGRLPSLTWQEGSPYYEQKGDEVVRNGSFTTGRPLTTKFYFFLSRILGVFGLENRVFPPLMAADSEYTCRIVAKMKTTFQQQYPDSRFIYYLHPFLSQPAELGECLTKMGVEWFEGRPPAFGAKWAIPFDGHPNAEANRAIAAEIASYIRKADIRLSSRNY